MAKSYAVLFRLFPDAIRAGITKPPIYAIERKVHPHYYPDLTFSKANKKTKLPNDRASFHMYIRNHQKHFNVNAVQDVLKLKAETKSRHAICLAELKEARARGDEEMVKRKTEECQANLALLEGLEQEELDILGYMEYANVRTDEEYPESSNK